MPDPDAEREELDRYMALYGERDGSAWFADDLIENDEWDVGEYTDRMAEYDIQDREDDDGD